VLYHFFTRPELTLSCWVAFQRTKNFYVVVSSIDTNLGRDRCLGSNLELKSSIVDTREVASTGRLVLLRLKSEGVNVDTSGRDVGVGLVWLDKVEVRTKTLGESVVAVKLELSTNSGVAASTLGSKTGVVSTTGSLVVLGEVNGGIVVGASATTLGKEGGSNLWGGLESIALRTILVLVDVDSREGDSGVARLDVGAESIIGIEETVGLDLAEHIVVEVISVVVPLVHAELDNRVTLNNPDKFLNWMIEVKLNLNVLRSDGLITSELELLDEVLVRDLSEASALISVEVDVIDVERSSLEGRNAEKVVVVKRDTAIAKNISSYVALVLLTELENDLNLVVLHLKYPIFRCIYLQKPRFPLFL
jgi:hypothetical protein